MFAKVNIKSLFISFRYSFYFTCLTKQSSLVNGTLLYLYSNSKIRSKFNTKLFSKENNSDASSRKSKIWYSILSQKINIYLKNISFQTRFLDLISFQQRPSKKFTVLAVHSLKSVFEVFAADARVCVFRCKRSK